MAARTCSGCERIAVRSCVCVFPPPLLCEEHCLNHSAGSHFPLPLEVLWHMQNIETQVKLKDRASKLRRQHSLINLYNDPQQQPTINIRDLLMQFYKDVEELKAEVKEFKAESTRGEEVIDKRTLKGTGDVLSALIWSEACPENELDTWVSIGHALSLKARFQYEESCRVLEDRWKLVQSNGGMGVLVLALVFSEVMGLHAGRFEEALAILEKPLQVANELYPKSEIALQLANMKAAILISSLRYKACLDFCNETILNFRGAPTSEVSFGTALYFYMFNIFSTDLSLQFEVKAITKEWILETENSSNSLVEYIRLYLSASLRKIEWGYGAAEGLITKAEEMVNRDFPTSIYAALSWFLNFSMKYQSGRIKDEGGFNEGECLRVHFPSSLLRFHILERKAEFYNRMRNKDKELEVRLSMHQLLQRNPNCDSFTRNVSMIITLYSNNDKATLDFRESVYRILFERSFASSAFINFQKTLRNFYQTRKKPEKAFEMYTEIIWKLQATDPTHKLLSEVLTTLAEWREDTQREKARQMCIELYLFLRDNYPCSENYRSAVQIVGEMHLKLVQQEKMENIFLEGLQIAKAFYNFKDYLLFFNTLARDLPLDLFLQEEKAAIWEEVYDFLISNIDPDCLGTANIIHMLFSDQPEKLLTILLAVFRTLLASPTSPELGEYLTELTSFYRETNQLDKAIEMRLKVHRHLLYNASCKNFNDNVEVLTDCYRSQKQIEKAIQFQVETSRLLCSHSTNDNYRVILFSLFNLCKEAKRQDIALEQFAEAYRTLQPDINQQYYWLVRHLCTLHYEVGNRDTALQIAQEFSNRSEFVAWAGRDLFFFKNLFNDLGQYELIVDMFTKAILIYYEKKGYIEIAGYFYYLFEALRFSRDKCKVIEKFLGIISGLEERHTEVFHNTLDCLYRFLGNECQESEEGIAIRKKVLLQVFSLRLCGFTIYEERHRESDGNMLNIIQQIGELYWETGEKEKAEAYFFRATRVAAVHSQLSSRKERDEYRSLYSGGQ